jgi:SOS response regulatory protein OraA/RecX
VYNEEDADFSDDESQAEISYITVKYCYRKPSDMVKAKQIKALLKQNGFIFDGAQDLVGENFYGKQLDFIFKEYI